jgi:hypothetical protein
MIASLEQTYQGYTFLARSREEGEVVQRLAERGWPAEDKEAARKAARQQGLAELQEMRRTVNRPLGGKWWKSREELYDE